MRLWHLKIKQYFPYKDLPFLLSVVLLFPSLSFHQKVTIQPPKKKRNSPGKNSCVEASFHFPASLLQPSRPAKHMMFLQIRCEKTEKDAFCHLSATGTASATLGLNSFISLFSYCSVEKAFSFLCRSLYSFQPPLGWISAILIHFTAKFHSSWDRKWRIPHLLLEVGQKLN